VTVRACSTVRSGAQITLAQDCSSDFVVGGSADLKMNIVGPSTVQPGLNGPFIVSIVNNGPCVAGNITLQTSLIPLEVPLVQVKLLKMMLMLFLKKKKQINVSSAVASYSQSLSHIALSIPFLGVSYGAQVSYFLNLTNGVSGNLVLSAVASSNATVRSLIVPLNVTVPVVPSYGIFSSSGVVIITIVSGLVGLVSWEL
jgi:hypothetical protein